VSRPQLSTFTESRVRQVARELDWTGNQVGPNDAALSNMLWDFSNTLTEYLKEETVERGDA